MTTRNSTPSISPIQFFSLTFLLSWLIWIPLALSHFEIGPFRIAEGTSSLVRLFGVLMPAVSAMILTSLAGGRSGLLALLGRLTVWRVSWQWWAAAVILQPVLLCAAALVHNLFGEPKITPAVLPTAGALVVNLVFLLLATLGEEIGWRGAALSGLQARYSALKSSAILGVLWAAWHVPFWLLLDSFDQFGVLYLGQTSLFVILGTFYITWFFNHTRQSLLLPVAFHFVFNIVNTVLLPVTISVSAFWIFIGFEFCLVLLLLPRLEPNLGLS
jgi:membrane protease YdiL (CAAX protease family)